MIGDLIFVFGLPAVITSLMWLIQKITGRLSASAKYFRRRVFGFLVLTILFVLTCGLLYLIYAVSNAPDGSNAGSIIGRRAGKFIFNLVILYGLGMRNEDGFLRAVFIPYSSLTPQAKERLISSTSQ